MAQQSNKIKAKNEVLRSYDTSGGDSTFQAVGAPLANVPRMVKFKNNSDVDITISYDQVNAHDIILAGDREIEDLTTNRTLSEGFGRSIGTQIYASSAAGTGSLYLTFIYAE